MYVDSYFYTARFVNFVTLLCRWVEKKRRKSFLEVVLTPSCYYYRCFQLKSSIANTDNFAFRNRQKSRFLFCYHVCVVFELLLHQNNPTLIDIRWDAKSKSYKLYSTNKVFQLKAIIL